MDHLRLKGKSGSIPKYFSWFTQPLSLSQWVQSRLLVLVIQGLAWANNVLYFNEVLRVQSRPINIWKNARQLKEKNPSQLRIYIELSE